MFKGVLVGFGIMLASLVIPVVHYVAAPLSPFVAGFIGGGVARINGDGIVKFGALMAGIMLIPVAVVLVVKFVFGIDEILRIPSTWWMIAVLIFIPYTWFGATLGALGGYLVRRNQSDEPV